MIARGSAVEKSFAGEPDESGSKYSGKAVDEFVRARTEAAGLTVYGMCSAAVPKALLS